MHKLYDKQLYEDNCKELLKLVKKLDYYWKYSASPYKVYDSNDGKYYIILYKVEDNAHIFLLDIGHETRKLLDWLQNAAKLIKHCERIAVIAPCKDRTDLVYTVYNANLFYGMINEIYNDVCESAEIIEHNLDAITSEENEKWRIKLDA
jgi:hypothetical protein